VCCRSRASYTNKKSGAITLRIVGQYESKIARRRNLTWASQAGKSGMIRVLMRAGLSKRRAERGVNAAFAAMTAALCRGEDVEVPGGILVVRTRGPRHRIRRFHRFRNVNGGALSYRIVQYGRRRCIQFRPDSDLDFSANPNRRLPSGAPDLNLPGEVQQLLSRLTGGSMRASVALAAYRAADFNGSRLIARLRALEQRVSPPRPEGELIQWIRDLYWIR
jgi:hypothetical protein